MLPGMLKGLTKINMPETFIEQIIDQDDNLIEIHTTIHSLDRIEQHEVNWGPLRVLFVLGANAEDGDLTDEDWDEIMEWMHEISEEFNYNY